MASQNDSAAFVQAGLGLASAGLASLAAAAAYWLVAARWCLGLLASNQRVVDLAVRQAVASDEAANKVLRADARPHPGGRCPRRSRRRSAWSGSRS